MVEVPDCKLCMLVNLAHGVEFFQMVLAVIFVYGVGLSGREIVQYLLVKAVIHCRR